MRSTEELWDRREERFERHPVRTMAIWIVGIVIFFGLIGGGIWGVNVLFAPAKGAGDAFAQKESAQNWTNAQAQFHQDWQSIQAFDAQINDAQAQLDKFEATHPQIGNGTAYDPMAEQDANLRRTLTGLTQQCQNTVASYNTRAHAYLSRDFRDAGLPAEIATGEHCVPTHVALPTTSTR